MSILWYCCIDDMPSAGPEWESLLSTLCSEEKNKITYFMFHDDQKRALGSILLQRAMIRAYWNVDDSEVSIIRTAENKPMPKIISHAVGTWNYNVTHHGRYVAIISNPHCLMGIDLVDISSRSAVAENFLDFSRMFYSEFHPMELRTMHFEETEDKKFLAFYINWALKEAFVKAVGLGLAYKLIDVRFYMINDWFQLEDDSGLKRTKVRGMATVFIKDIPQTEWRFQYWNIDERHVIAVAVGPISAAADSFHVWEAERSLSEFVSPKTTEAWTEDFSSLAECKSITSLLP